VVLYFAVFSIFPVLFGFALSQTDYDLLIPPDWVELDNFRALFADRLLLTAFANTLVFVAGTTVPV
jgi:multiple sugar transport system permease protein